MWSPSRSCRATRSTRASCAAGRNSRHQPAQAGRGRACRSRESGAPCAAARSGRPARGWHRPRLQQPADGDLGLRRHDRRRAPARVAAAGRRRGDQKHRDPWRRAHASATGLLTPPGHGAAAVVTHDRGARLGRASRTARGRAHHDPDPARPGSRGDPRRSRRARSGARQPRRQRTRRDARRRRDRDPDQHRGRPTRGQRVDGPRSVRRPLGRRHGLGDGSRDGGTDLRAVLHDEGTGQGHRPRAGDRVRHREPVRRSHRRRHRSQRGNDVHDLVPRHGCGTAGGRRGRGTSDRATGGSRRAGAPRRGSGERPAHPREARQ